MNEAKKEEDNSEDREMEMYLAHGCNALRQVSEMDCPSLVVMFDIEKGEAYFVSDRIQSLTKQQRQHLYAAVGVYLNNPVDQ